ncbi:PGAP1-like family protein [Burkholderia sp. MSHR3999]|uniref:esterase/lipase family protein n=1 Tax=Burkholderia sp. MSHR3999 TaxID=1542965 RepID=UPI0005B742EF|nr:hypothetical protein [Burkholderia sp. MSHR3999]KIP16525.1 PGAP1-like family protein [Burkholderia sp. MSHR3999]
MNIEDLPPPKTNNRWYRNYEANEVLVFVHGVLSDSRNCWLACEKATNHIAYWPTLISSDPRFRNVGLYLGGYHTDVDSGDFPLQQCAAQLFSYLKTPDSLGRPPVLSKRKITFVCHSMGGIVARYLLCEYWDDFKDKDVGIVLVASPSYGSKLQHSLDHIIHLYNHEQGKQLKWGNQILRDLDERFKNLINGKKIKSFHGVEFFENRFIVHYRWLPWFSRTKVVSNESAARYFGYAKMVGGSDHMSICKPRSVEDAVHQYLLVFLNDNGLLPAKDTTTKETQNILGADLVDRDTNVAMGSSVDAPDGIPGRVDQNSASPSYEIVRRSRRNIKFILADFQSSDPVNGSNALFELLDRKAAGEEAVFRSPLLVPTMQVRRRMFEYVGARAETVTPLLLARLQGPRQSSDAEVAATLLAGIPSSPDILSQIKHQLSEDFADDLSLRNDESGWRAARRLLALGNAGAYARDILDYVDHDGYAWEKLATFAFRGACAAFSRGARSDEGPVAKLVVQTGHSDAPFPSPDISSKDIPSGAVATEEIDHAVFKGAFSTRHNGAVVDHVLLNWSNENTHWRVRYLGAGIVASAAFERTTYPVDEWLQRESDPDVRSNLFLALASADSAVGAEALLARYLQYHRTEGLGALSRSLWRCNDRDAAIAELESLGMQSVESYPALVVSLARLGRRFPNLESLLSSDSFFVRANAALAIGYLRDGNYRNRLRSQLREAAAPIERICVAAALLMVDASSTESELHNELVAACDHEDIRFRIDPYFLWGYIKEAILDAFMSVNSKDTLVMDGWRREFQPLF